MTQAQFKKIGIFKCGNIGTSPLLELLLDELADRKDIKVRTVTTGSKMGPEDVEEALPKIFELNPDLLIVISPNTSYLDLEKLEKRYRVVACQALLFRMLLEKGRKRKLRNKG